MEGLDRRTFLMLAVASGGSLPIGDQLRPGKAPTRQNFS
jgi:hypothetical protein